MSPPVLPEAGEEGKFKVNVTFLLTLLEPRG